MEVAVVLSRMRSFLVAGMLTVAVVGVTAGGVLAQAAPSGDHGAGHPQRGGSRQIDRGGAPAQQAGPARRGAMPPPEEIAEFVGLEPRELGRALGDGQTLAQIALAHGKSRDELKAFLLAEAKEYLDADVAAGRLTRARADDALQQLTDDLDAIVDRVGPPPRPPRRGGRA
jgi:hypothetical protein